MPRFDWWKTCKACGKRFGWNGTPSDEPPCPNCAKKQQQADGESGNGGPAAGGVRRGKSGGIMVAAPVKDEVEEALEQCERICDGIDELPSRAWDVWEPDSVRDTVMGIEETIRRTNCVTGEQRRSLENIETAVSNWINR